MSLITEVATAGTLVTATHLAALAISHGAELVSCETESYATHGAAPA